MTGNILISTIYEDTSILSIKICANEFKINKIIMLVDKNPKKETEAKQKFVVAEIKKLFSDILPIETFPIDLYKISEIAKDVIKIIDAQSGDSKIIVNVSQGRKLQAWATYFAALKRTEKINKIIYITEEKKEIIELPKISLKLSDKKIEILKNIEQLPITDISEKVDLHNAMVYRHLKKLQKEGFLEKKDGAYKLTDAGLIAIL